ncbi:HAD-like protein [Pluteus cervinus]|uniref:HAD-like protein n=1 Tax=Pluteus cervinus TaxID=181527 RepID=A0ACD3BBG3_9AGAR|nr:HAD-like protein [Pluteus cervinus]
MSAPLEFTTIIFDLGDVLFKWSAPKELPVSPKTLRKILSSPTWFNYERGLLTEDECYEQVGQEYSLQPSDIRRAFLEARESLVANDDLIALIHELKKQSEGQLRVFAMSNISKPDYAVLRTKPADWSVFDEVFTSGMVGERKPHLGFYRHVVATTRIDPRRTIFVDDKLENVLSARSLGMYGIVFDSPGPVKRALRNLIGDPISRGREYLRQNAGHLESVTAGTEQQEPIALHENFAQLLILEVTGDRSLVNLVEHPRTWNFFHGGKGQLTTEEFPFDLDTTSLGLTVLRRDKEVAMAVMTEMLEYVDTDGIIQTYFDHKRPRFDPVVCVNALSLFYSYGRGSELSRTSQWIYEVLFNRAYLEGTRYYETAECFLYFISRLLATNGDADLHALLKSLLKERIQERIGAEGDALALAMRILVCDFVGIRDEIDLRALLPLQCDDGGWEIGWIYKYGSSGIKIGNRGLTTALAIKAIETMAQPVVRFVEQPQPPSRSSSPLSFPFKLNAPTSPKSRHRRNSSLKNSLQWLWHGGKVRKSVEIVPM